MGMVWKMGLLSLGLAAIMGCARGPSAGAGPDRVFFVPGVAGDGPWYNELRQGLAEGGLAEGTKTIPWGAPPPLTMLNFQSATIHNGAEAKLARQITQWRREHPKGRIRLIGHSAGGGVILGGLARLDPATQVDEVILLHPSVSPQYDLSTPLQRVRDKLHLFHSNLDKVFLGWRTSTFGSYDNVKTEAAGKVGFRPAASLPPELSTKLVQHGYQPHWESAGNNGDHFGATARQFVATEVAPLIR